LRLEIEYISKLVSSTLNLPYRALHMPGYHKQSTMTCMELEIRQIWHGNSHVRDRDRNFESQAESKSDAVFVKNIDFHK